MEGQIIFSRHASVPFFNFVSGEKGKSLKLSIGAGGWHSRRLGPTMRMAPGIALCGKGFGKHKLLLDGLRVGKIC